MRIQGGEAIAQICRAVAIGNAVVVRLTRSAPLGVDILNINAGAVRCGGRVEIGNGIFADSQSALTAGDAIPITPQRATHAVAD